MKQIENIFTFSHVVKLYVPGTIEESKTAINLQRIETGKAVEFMAGLFGGCTSGRYSGAWKNEAGQIIEEPVNIVYSFFDGDLDKVLKLVEYAKGLCNRMKQDCISLEFDGRLAFIPSE